MRNQRNYDLCYSRCSLHIPEPQLSSVSADGHSTREKRLGSLNPICWHKVATTSPAVGSDSNSNALVSLCSSSTLQVPGDMRRELEPSDCKQANASSSNNMRQDNGMLIRAVESEFRKFSLGGVGVREMHNCWSRSLVKNFKIEPNITTKCRCGEKSYQDFHQDKITQT